MKISEKGRIHYRRSLGQHFLVSSEVCRKLVQAAQLSPIDTVFEIGTGHGILTRYIAPQVKRVITCEKDYSLFLESKEQFTDFRNVEILFGDAFTLKEIEDISFEVCVTSLPYSRSLDFIRWLSLRSGSFRSSVAIIQSDFAHKLIALPHAHNYRSVSVLAQIAFKIKQIDYVDKASFKPQPRVQSVIIKFEPNTDFIQPFFDASKVLLLSQLFSFRGKLLRNAIRSLVTEKSFKPIEESLQLKRIEDITPMEFATLLTTIESGI